MDTYRAFTLALLSCICLAALHAQAAAPSGIDTDRLNRTMEMMKTFGGKPNGGSGRVAYSDANREALSYLAELMASAGMTTHIDLAGNLIGRRDGSTEGLKPLMTGSHIDTVPDGGHYDGIVGVMAAIEVARSLHDAGHRLRHPLEVVVWSNEEGGKTGSRSFNGSVAGEEMSLPSLGGRTLGDGMRFLGGDPDRLAENARQPGSIAGYLELHIEQGAILDRENLDIGIVEGIVGIKRWNVVVEGFANHAGTTPMAQRRDAMFAAARVITAVEEVIRNAPGRHVGTVGRLAAEPGAPNVVPGRATFSLEIRDLDMDKINRLQAAIEAAAQTIAARSNTNIRFEQFYESPAALTSDRIRRWVADSADALELSSQWMPSGAGHDAQSLAPITEIGMIFVPSVDGISHAPGEFTDAADIANGGNVLLHTLLKMDSALAAEGRR